MLKLRIMARVEMSSLLHRDFLGAHRYTTRGSMCVLRRPLHGAGCLSSIVIRGNDLSPSLRYPFVYFAFVIGLKTRPITNAKSVGGASTVSCAKATTERWWQDGC